MSVRRVTSADGRSSWVEPPLELWWSPLERLRWHLAVVLLDAGAPPDALEVHPARLTVNGVAVSDVFEIRRRGGSLSALSYDGTWSYLNGWGEGYRAARS